MPTHKNPVLSGFNPDPSLVRVGDDYFLVTSTFEFFPGVPIYHSKDVINWTLIGHALTRPSQLNIRTVEPGAGIWAPTIRYHEGRFYIATACWTRYCPQQDVRVWPRGFYVSTSNVWDSNSWSDPVYFDQPGFDQDLFWDDNGKVYLSTCYRAIDHDPSSGTKGFATHISQIDLATGNSLTPPQIIRKSPSGVAEGAHILKINSFYYLFVAEGGTWGGHCEMVFRSLEGPFGPWDPAPGNPLLSSTDKDDVHGTGHADIVEDVDGRWWATCLAVRPHRIKGKDGEEDTFVPAPRGRETFLMSLVWKDGWPVFNQGKKLELTFEADPPIHQEDVDWTDDFEADNLALGWYTKNTPLKRDYSLTERKGSLRLWGGPYDLKSMERPTMYLQKQKHTNGTWKTVLDFEPSSPHYEAGTVLYWNYYTFASIGIRQARSSTEREIVFTRPSTSVGTFEQSVHPLHDKGSVSLAIGCSDTSYRFGYSEASSSETAKWLEEEIAMEVMTAEPPSGLPFTGMMFGLYSFGKLQPCLSPADFSSASFTHAYADNER